MADKPTEAGDTEILLEEIEVLPYDSVFDWTLTDPLGFYKEDERYQRLKAEYGNDQLKSKVIDDMWADRKKYHILRRFTWPPKLLLGTIFYSRGYYEDYEARPTVDLSQVSDNPPNQDDAKRTRNYKTVKKQLYEQVVANDVKQGIIMKEKPEQAKVIEMIEVGGENNNTIIEVEEPKTSTKKKSEPTALITVEPLKEDEVITMTKAEMKKSKGGKKKGKSTTNILEEAVDKKDRKKSKKGDEGAITGENLNEILALEGAAEGGGEKKKKKKKKKKPAEPETEVIEEVSYEVVKKPKDPNKKKKKKKKKEQDESAAEGTEALKGDGEEGKGGEKEKKRKSKPTKSIKE